MLDIPRITRLTTTYVHAPRVAVRHMNAAEDSLRKTGSNGPKARINGAANAVMTTEDKANIAAYVSSDSPAVDLGCIAKAIHTMKEPIVAEPTVVTATSPSRLITRLTLECLNAFIASNFGRSRRIKFKVIGDKQ